MSTHFNKNSYKTLGRYDKTKTRFNQSVSSKIVKEDFGQSINLSAAIKGGLNPANPWKPWGKNDDTFNFNGGNSFNGGHSFISTI